MGWLLSIVIGVLTAVVTMLAAGYVANLSAGWYRISSFEGASGYFVVGLALVGLVAGLIIGIVVSRLVGAGAHPGFLKALGISWGVSLGCVAVLGGVARLRADIAPRPGGEELILAVEFRWPAGRPLPTVGDPGEWLLRLSSLSGRTLRASRTGPLWREDARLENGQWVVPGAVDLFTSRGDRLIDVVPQGVVANGFLVPLPGRPGSAHREWSDWLPPVREGQPVPGDGVTYRFRVVPRSEPIRTETLGPFEVATIAHSLGEVTYGNLPPMWTADAEFTVRHDGRPLTIERQGETGAQARVERMSAVAAVNGPSPALLVQVAAQQRVGSCYLVVSEPGGLRIAPVGRCDASLRWPLTNDAAVFSRAPAERVPDGRFDRVSFARSRFYLLSEGVLDSETLTVRPLPAIEHANLIERIPPVGVAPDGRSMVRLAWDGTSSDELALAVIRLDSGQVTRLPIDRSRMRLGEIEQVDPAWVLHHFEWQHTPAGVDRLVERAGFTPLPYCGVMTVDQGGYREYRVGPALAGLRPALIDFLVESFGAERLPAEEGAFSHEVRIGADTVHVSFDEREGHVGIWMDRGADSRLVAEIAGRFDAALATSRFDHLFAR